MPKLSKKIIISLTSRKEDPQMVEGVHNKLRKCKKILLLRQDRIGDVLITVPFLRALRSQLPGVQIDILFSRKNYAAARATEKYVDNMHLIEGNPLKMISSIKKLRKKKYDLAVDLLDNPSSSGSLIVKYVNSIYSLGFDKDNSQVYTHVVPLPDKRKHHIIDRLKSLLLPFKGKDFEYDSSLEYPISKEEQKAAENKMGAKESTRIGINLSGSNESKFWGVENNNELIKKIKSDKEIFVFTTKDKKEIAEKVVLNTAAKVAPFVSSFNEYASLLQTCDVIITPDTSAVHLSSAFDIPCIALYLQSKNPNVGMPWYPTAKFSKPLTTDTGNLADISVKNVHDALNEILEEIE